MLKFNKIINALRLAKSSRLTLVQDIAFKQDLEKQLANTYFSKYFFSNIRYDSIYQFNIFSIL